MEFSEPKTIVSSRHASELLGRNLAGARLVRGSPRLQAENQASNGVEDADQEQITDPAAAENRSAVTREKAAAKSENEVKQRDREEPHEASSLFMPTACEWL